MKTSELAGAALDWAVAKCENKVEQGAYGTPELRDDAVYLHYCDATLNGCYSPSTSWAQGGPIIDREGIGFFQKKEAGYCQAAKPGAEFVQRGPTALIAAMRCYVASKLGDEVEIPAELQ